MKNKKGISPLIATVLLIGFTIVLAALVMRWGTELFEGTAETQECLSLARIDCTELDFSLSATYENETFYNVSLIVRNNGAKDVDNFIFVGVDENGATTQYGLTDELFSITDNTIPVNAFDSHTFVFDFSSDDVMDDTVAIEVIPAITHTADDGDSCKIECTEKSETYRGFDWVA